ncbi:MAG: hypothetical protein RTV41_13850 [Candidatus Thorarchaeota archaeon]
MRRGKLKGYEGNITRVVRIAGAREYFISGTLETTFEQALRDNWPFEDHDIKKSKFRIMSDKGEDVTKRTLGSHEGTVMVEFHS